MPNIGKNQSDLTLNFSKAFSNNKPIVGLSLLLLVVVACNREAKDPESLFSYLPSEQSGISFSNTIESTDSINILNYIYAYNGSGVGIGDINNDGLEDIFFAGNQSTSRLYVNEGDLKFKDITSSAGVKTNTWCTGVSVVDINADGYLDIYVSVAGSPDSAKRANLLFLNNGDETFQEAAELYGIADQSYTTHAAFFDYDRDGDLDLYLLNHANDRASLNTPVPKKTHGEGASTDKLFRNNGPEKPFTDVSDEAGILIEGYGLGVAVNDINQDGWPDLYISNDFITNDLLYINNQNGTFTNVIDKAIQEQTYNGMGNDVSDFNNDGLPDIVAMDMLPPDPVSQKTMAGSMTYDKYTTILSAGYEPQFMRNTLQLNQGELLFTEIGRFAGIHRTDWSWAPLLADFDNDGWKDLYVTNGYLKDITDKDFVDYNNNLSMFKAQEVVNKETLERIEQLKGRKLPNFMFRNGGDMTFSDKTKDWGLNRESFSNGAAYADLDKDGDLDLVINNINSEAFIIRNNKKSAEGFLSLQLRGPERNPRGVGAKVSVTSTSGKQVVEQAIYRGFMSSVSERLHFGTGADSTIKKVVVTWPDGTYQELTNVSANQQLEIKYNAAAGREVFDAVNNILQFKDVTTQLGITYEHPANDPVNFKAQPLLPFKLSGKGPEIAAGDLDGNGLDDLVAGGGIGTTTTVFFQQVDGTFMRMEVKESEGDEVMGIAIFDANQDGLNDLYLACGGVSYQPGDPHYVDKLYLGTGSMELTVSKDFLPKINTSTSTVKVGDYDRDGDLDLFVGGYAHPKNFPAAPRSYLLENTVSGFVDVTEEVAKELSTAGMVRDAEWADYNNDGQLDLVVVGEWMPVMVFENSSGNFKNITEALGLHNLTGWWQSISANDVDNDGDTDFICGNVGLNSSYRTSIKKPVKLYAPDLDQDGTYDPLMTYFVGDIETIQASRGVLFKRQPFLNRKFTDHLSFAQATIKDIIPEGDISTTYTLNAQTFNSVVLLNDGNGTFEIKSLPNRAQLFPINDIVQLDFDSNGLNDFVAVGGFLHASYDGESLGPAQVITLNNNNSGNFTANTLKIHLDGDISSVTRFSHTTGELIALGINGSDLKIIQINDTLVVRQ